MSLATTNGQTALDAFGQQSNCNPCKRPVSLLRLLLLPDAAATHRFNLKSPVSCALCNLRKSLFICAKDNNKICAADSGTQSCPDRNPDIGQLGLGAITRRRLYLRIYRNFSQTVHTPPLRHFRRSASLNRAEVLCKS